MPIPHTFTVPRALALALAVTSSSTAFAQESGEFSLEEIVITAQKREETIQDAMLSVRAVAPEELSRAGVKDFTQLSKVAPEINVNFQQTFSVVAIRGVRSNAFSPNDESANALHMDGAYLAGFQGLRGMFFDIQRIEILSGPQGTLYGRNATGGSVNIISNRPGHEFGGNASLDVGNYNLISAEAAINLPVSETLSFRVAGRHYKHDGYYKDTGTDDADQNSGRLSMLWNLTDTQTLWAAADIEHEGGKGVGQNIIAQGPRAYATVNPSGAVVPVTAANTTVSNGYYINSPGIAVSSDPWRNAVLYGNADQAKTNTQATGYAVEYTNDLGFATWNVLGSYRALHQRQQQGSAQQDLQPTFNIPATFSLQYVNWKALETRLTSKSSGTLKWVVGLYGYQHTLERADNIAYLTNFRTSAVPPNPWTGQPAADPGNTNATGQAGGVSGIVNTDGINNFTHTKAYAVFGESTWSPITTLHSTGGARYNVDHKEAQGSAFNIGAFAPAPLGSAINFNPIYAAPYSPATSAGKGEWKKVTWKVNVAYDLTTDNSVYLNVAKGYKAGAISFGPRPKIDPENVIAYEIGSKNEFFNKRVRLNAAAWFLKYENYQTVVLQCFPGFSGPSCGFQNPPSFSVGPVNAGAAEHKGASLSLDALLSDADKVTFSAQYVDAKYTDFNLTGDARVVPAVALDYTGTPVAFVAKWSGSTSYTHVWNIGDGTLDAQIAGQYASRRLLQNSAVPGQSNFLQSNPAATWDLSSKYSPNKTWDVTVYVNNLFDKLVVTNAGASPPVYSGGPPPANTVAPTVNYYTVNYAAPRTFGVKASLKF